MSIWEAHDLEAKIRALLSEVKYRSNPDHHFGTPFVTAYQLAIELNKRYPEIAKEQNAFSENYLFVGKKLADGCYNQHIGYEFT